MIRGAVVFLLTGLLSLGPTAAGQQAGGPEIVGVRVGVAGRYKPGCWTPVEVTLRGVGKLNRGRLILTVPDGDGIPSRFSTPLPCHAAEAETENLCSKRGKPPVVARSPDRATPGAGSGDPRRTVSAPLPCPAADVETDETPVVLYTRFGRIKSPLAVELRADDRLLDRKEFKPGEDPHYWPAILSGQELVVTVGRESLGVEDAVRVLHQDPDRSTVVVRLDDLDGLPTQWFGYEGVDTVVLSTSDPAIYADSESVRSRIAALDDWVRLGGKLVVCAGREAEAMFRRDPEAPLARFAPGRLEKIVSLPFTSAWELYCGSSVSVPEVRGGIRVPYLVDIEGKTEAADGPLPLVVRAARGFGQVVFVAADLDCPPLAEWEDRQLLVGKLLGYPATPVDEDSEGTAVMHYGFTDLAGQLRSALDRFSNVWLVPFSLVVMLVVLYILAIGPGDYFLLRKVVRRMQLTWITFPLIVVAFSVTAYVLAHRFKGALVRVNQLDMVDVDCTGEDGDRSGRVRGTAWANVFSPRMGRYDLAFQPRLPAGGPVGQTTALTAWLGLPGNALGGMDPTAAEPDIWREPYDFATELNALRGVPIQVWSTKSLTARWTGRIGAGVEARLTEEDSLPAGTITNALAFPLAECLLAYGSRVYELGTIEPGRSITVGPRLNQPRELKSLLTGRQILFNPEKEDYRPQVTPYDRASLDVEYILRTMMFFEDAGGRRYTGLSNRYQGFVDLSHLLKTNRAVLVGRAEAGASNAPRHGATLLCNGRPIPQGQLRHTTIYRFVFPVEGK